MDPLSIWNWGSEHGSQAHIGGELASAMLDWVEPKGSSIGPSKNIQHFKKRSWKKDCNRFRHKRPLNETQCVKKKCMQAWEKEEKEQKDSECNTKEHIQSKR